MLVAVASRASTTAQKAYVFNPHTDSILINTDKVMDGLVTELKLADGAVAEAKLAAGAVTEGKIAALSIVAGHIQALQIDVGHINTNAITSEKINAGAITALKIDAGAVDATKLAAEIILASVIWAGENTVKLSSSGIEVKADDGLQIYSGSTKYGRVYVAGSLFGLKSEDDIGMYIGHTGTAGNITITTGTGIYLAHNGTTIFGINSARAYVASGKYFGLPTGVGQARDICVSGNDLVYVDSSGNPRTLTGTT